MSTPLRSVRKVYLRTLKATKAGSALACRLVQWTGKSRWPIHPKHLVDVRPPWYLQSLCPSDVVLDLGCGNGQHTLRVAPSVRSIVGVDYDSKLLAVAEADTRARGVGNVRFTTADLEGRFPFTDAAFDVVLALDVLEHLHHRGEAFREMHRLLKTGGRLLIAVPNRETSWKRRLRAAGVPFYSDPDHKYEYTRDEFLAECARHGFRVTRCDPVVVDVWFAGLIDIIGGLSLGLYRRLLRWKVDTAQRQPEESIGFEIVAERQ